MQFKMEIVRVSVRPGIKVPVGAFTSISLSEKDVVGRNSQLQCS